MESISAVCRTPRSQSRQCAGHHRDDLSILQHTAETISAFCNTPQRQTMYIPRSQNWNLNLSLVAFKETIRKNPFSSEHIYHERKDFKYKILICKEKFFVSAVCCTPRRHFCDRIARKIETEFENTLACLSGAHMGSNHEKKLEVENLVTLSLSCWIGLATCRKNRIRVSNRHVEIASGVCRKG